MIACEVVFKGQVQGVGFRCTARDMAREIGVTGRVKNLSDGSVRLIVEGEEAGIDDLISRLELYFSIREKQVVRSSAMCRWTDFAIEY